MDLDELRENIDDIDEQILTLFLRRMGVAEQIACSKAEQGLPILNSQRERQILQRMEQQAGELGVYARQLFAELLRLSKERQAELGATPQLYGLIGRGLSHSFSVPLHRMLGNPGYQLFELGEEQQVAEFLAQPSLAGVNITMPYKRSVPGFCQYLSPLAAATGSVNTIVRSGSELRGYNTDAVGFAFMAEQMGVDFRGKNVLIFGSGGTNFTVKMVIKQHDPAKIITLSRQGPDNYQNLERHTDAEILINATPLGMYPHNGPGPADPALFPACRWVLDLVYNPLRSAWLQRAEQLHIPCSNGLLMLVAQARAAEELFFGRNISDEETLRIARELRLMQGNMVLIGMPGCGKSTVGRELARLSGRRAVDIDREIEAVDGRKPAQIIIEDGEAAFRQLERQCIERWGRESGLVIVCGGGAALDRNNLVPLRQNGRIYWLQRRLEALARQGRPLSEQGQLQEMYQRRRPCYQAFAEVEIDNNGSAAQAAAAIWRDYHENFADQRP